MTAKVATHLVGSLPFTDAYEAMSESLGRLGDSLPYLSDGETGERGNYVAHLVGRLAKNPALDQRTVTMRLGRMESETPEFFIRRGAKLTIPLGELGYCRDWQQSLDLFRATRAQRGRADLRYQMCLATPFSIAMPYFRKPVDMLRAIGPIQTALRAEVAEAVRVGRDVLVVQLDAALEQIAVAATYDRFSPLGHLLARWFARQIVGVATSIPADVPVGMHLCYGNPMNARVVTPRTSDPTVVFANAIAAAWPTHRPLNYIHFPIVDSADPHYYTPLRRFRLPPGTRLIAGLVYEDGHAANEERFKLATQSLGFAPDIATACGMGRRTSDVARDLLDEMRVLTTVQDV